MVEEEEEEEAGFLFAFNPSLVAADRHERSQLAATDPTLALTFPHSTIEPQVGDFVPPLES